MEGLTRLISEFQVALRQGRRQEQMCRYFKRVNDKKLSTRWLNYPLHRIHNKAIIIKDISHDTVQ